MADEVKGESEAVEETQENTGLEATEEVKSPEADEISEEAEETPIVPLEESVPLVDDTEAEVVDVESLLAEPASDDEDLPRGAIKRIDKLTARLKDAEEKLAKQQDKESIDTGKYTPDQLNKAYKKAIEEGDSALAMDVMDYKIDQVKESLRKEYQAEQKQNIQQQQQINKEWISTVEKYDEYTSSDNEIYDGSSKDLNLKDQKSLLHQLAVRLYSTQQEDAFQRYHKPGGQELAVADAFQLILKKKRGTPPKDKEKDLLKRKLAKEKRKKSLGSGSPGAEDKSPAKPKNKKEALDEYLSERRKLSKLE